MMIALALLLCVNLHFFNINKLTLVKQEFLMIRPIFDDF